MNAMSRPILLVEDNPDEEALALVALRKCQTGHKVVMARDGVQALALLRGGEEKPGLVPELVLLDLKLPKLDGLEVLRQLRREPRTQLVPVVVLSTSAAAADVEGSYRAGANSYLRKPIDFDEFVELIRSTSRYWLTLNLPVPQAAGEDGQTGTSRP